MSAPDSSTSILPSRRAATRTVRSRQGRSAYRSQPETQQPPQEIFLNVREVGSSEARAHQLANTSSYRPATYAYGSRSVYGANTGITQGEPHRSAINPSYRQNSQIGSVYQPRSLYTQGATQLSGASPKLLPAANSQDYVETNYARGREERAARRRSRELESRGPKFSMSSTGALGSLASQLSARGAEFFSAGFEGVKRVRDAVCTGGKSAVVASSVALNSRQASAAVPARTKRGLGALKVAAIVALVVLALGAFMYAPVKALYCAKRNAQLYQTQLATLAQSNQSYQEKVQYLESRSGIEDLARKRGYVYEGETAVSVDGAPTDAAAQADTQAATSTLDGVTTQDPWYIKLCDQIFDYQPSDKVG